MARYLYEGFDSSGGKVSSTIDAESVTVALSEARSKGLTIIRIDEVGTSIDFREFIGIKSDRISLSDLEFLTAELSLLLRSGVRIDRAIGLLRTSGKSAPVRKLLDEIWGGLKQGMQLSQCLERHPRVFDALYVNLVSLGESGGRLPEVFEGLAEELKFRRELRQKVISAATYPLVVAAVCVLAIVFIFNFVVPNMASLFADADDLPWYTQVLLGSSDFMLRWQWMLFGGTSVVMVMLWQQRKRPSVAQFINRLLLETPGIRDANALLERIRFSGGLALMLEAGLPIDRALTLATGNIRHATLRREMSSAVESVKRGEQLSQALRKTRLFPSYQASLIEVGEESARLAMVFREMALRGRESFTTWALRVTTLLEPLLILFMGLIVGSVVVVMMLSITSVTDVGL